jgi:hypothetical protein
MTTPALFAQVLKLHQQLPDALAFDLLHQITRWYVRWNRYKQVHVILAYVALQYPGQLLEVYIGEK